MQRSLIATSVLLPILAACGGSGGGAAPAPAGPTDTTAPSILAFDPANGTGDVATTATLAILFSEAIDPASISASTIQLIDVATGGPVDFAATLSGDELALQPRAALDHDTRYRLVAGAVADLAGNQSQAADAEFTTIPAPIDHLDVTASSPAAGETDVRLDAQIQVTFDQAVDASTIDTDSFRVTGPRGQVFGEFTVQSNEVAFRPFSPLDAEATFNVEISSAVVATSGTGQQTPHAFTFTTVNRLNLLQHSPAEGEVDVRVDTPVVVRFDVELDPATVTDRTVFVRPTRFVGGSRFVNGVEGRVEHSGSTLTFTPDDGWLEYGTGYEVTINGGLRGINGEPVQRVEFRFTAIFLDPDFYYQLSTELRDAFLSCGNSSRQAFVDSSAASRDTLWRFVRANEGRFIMINAQDEGTDLALEGGTGAGPAFVTARPGGGAVFTGQLWGFTFANPRSGRAVGRESFRAFNMDTLFREPTGETLGLRTNNQTRVLEAVMDNASQRTIDHMWWFRRVERV